ncbi:unnamed protein product, partial [Cyprideis torosa]
MVDLWSAIAGRRYDDAIALIRGGADGRWAHEVWRETALHLAAKRAHSHMVDLLLRNGAEVDAQDRWKRTPLLRAIERESSPSEEEDRLRCAEFLLQAGANVRHCDDDGNNALHYASESRFLSIAQHLLTVDASLCLVKNSQGNTAITLQQAAEWGHPAIISILLQHGVQVDKADGWKRTPLLRAIGWGSPPSEEEDRLQCVKILLHDGANVRHCDGDGNNALHYATESRYPSIVKHLLTVDPSLCLVKNSLREAALTLQQAAEWGLPNSISLLLQHGALVYAQDRWKRTPLLQAIGWRSSPSEEEDRLRCVEVLLQAKANVRHCDQDGKNALHYATENRYLSIAQHLETVDPSLGLMNAAEKVDFEKVSLLLQKGAQVNAEDGWKRTPLLWAIGWKSSPSEEEDRLRCVEVLLQAGADIRHCDEDGDNALHYAVKSRFLSIVQHLIIVDRSLLDVKNKKGKTPSDLAEGNIKAHIEKVEGLLDRDDALWYAVSDGDFSALVPALIEHLKPIDGPNPEGKLPYEITGDEKLKSLLCPHNNENHRYKRVGYIAAGSFGQVDKVQHKVSEKLFARKLIKNDGNFMSGSGEVRARE